MWGGAPGKNCAIVTANDFRYNETVPVAELFVEVYG